MRRRSFFARVAAFAAGVLGVRVAKAAVAVREVPPANLYEPIPDDLKNCLVTCVSGTRLLGPFFPSPFFPANPANVTLVGCCENSSVVRFDEERPGFPEFPIQFAMAHEVVVCTVEELAKRQHAELLKTAKMLCAAVARVEKMTPGCVSAWQRQLAQVRGVYPVRAKAVPGRQKS